MQQAVPVDGGGGGKQLGPRAGGLPAPLFGKDAPFHSRRGEASGDCTQIHARMPGLNSHSMSNPSPLLSDFGGGAVCSGPPVPQATHAPANSRDPPFPAWVSCCCFRGQPKEGGTEATSDSRRLGLAPRAVSACPVITDRLETLFSAS